MALIIKSNIRKTIKELKEKDLLRRFFINPLTR